MVTELNFLKVYTYERWAARNIPVFHEGEHFTPSSLRMAQGCTTAPSPLTEAELIAEMDTNEIGFYLNSRMGLGFNREVLAQQLESQRKFRNSIFVVYDTSKANFGLNPLKAYRLTQRALDAFQQNHGTI